MKPPGNISIVFAWRFHLYVPDYQGNIIGVVNTTTGNPEQVTTYYPYGTPHSGGMGESANRRAFGGKEYTGEYGVHTLDFGARPYAPLTARFHCPDPLSAKFPHISPYAYCAGDPVNFTDPTGLMPNKEEGARMCDYVYSGRGVLLVGGWREAQNTFGITVRKGNYGLKAMLFEREINGKLEYAYVYAGTDFFSKEDWIQNYRQLSGNSEQYKLAIQNAETLARKINFELTFLGHSLGGGLAAASAYATGGVAMTYNAAGVSQKTIEFNPQADITAYVIRGDELDDFQRMAHLPRANGKVVYEESNSLIKHSIKNFYTDTKPSLFERFKRLYINWEKNFKEYFSPKNLMFPF